MPSPLKLLQAITTRVAPEVAAARVAPEAAVAAQTHAGKAFSPNFTALKVYEQPSTKRVYHATDADAPTISARTERLIPESLSAANSPDSIWGQRMFKVTIPKGAKVGEIDSIFSLLPEGVEDTPMNLGRLLRKYAADNELDVLKIRRVGGVGTEWAIMNPEFLSNAEKIK